MKSGIALITRLRLVAIGVTVVALLSACRVASPRNQDSRDPLERLNRATFSLNDHIDRAVAAPIARTYRRVVPYFAQQRVTNVFANASYPTVLVGNIAQGKLKAAAQDVMRLAVNTSVGIGGLFDPATALEIPAHDEDLGQTLGRWGIPSGAYLVLPLLGPSSLRDGIGLLGDQWTEPRHYLTDKQLRWSLWATRKLDKRVRLLETDAVLARTGDKYTFVRSAYLQRREFLVQDGAVADFLPTDEGEDEPMTILPPKR